jgi:predicted nucleotidyltransferase
VKTLDCLDLVHEASDVLREDGRTAAILLFGSAARETVSRTSDIDLLVVHHGPVPEEVFDRINEQISISFYSPERLLALPANSPLFAIHLAREGRAIWDPDHRFKNAFGGVRVLSQSDARRLKTLTSWRLTAVLRDPFFDLSDDLSAGQLYALTKQAAMIASALQRDFEFDRHSALSDLAKAHRSLRQDAHAVALLEDAWLARRKPSMSGWQPEKAVEAKADDAAARVIARVVGDCD